MGNCINSNIILNNAKSHFLNSNLIDKEYNIIIGIYVNSNKHLKLNTMINQGIYIGSDNKINKIKLGIIQYYYDKKMVELYFENNIKIVFIREEKNKIKMILNYDKSRIEKYIDIDIIKQYKLINNNSEFIDLIYKLI